MRMHSLVPVAESGSIPRRAAFVPIDVVFDDGPPDWAAVELCLAEARLLGQRLDSLRSCVVEIAADAARDGVPLRALDVRAVQEELERQGAVVF